MRIWKHLCNDERARIARCIYIFFEESKWYWLLKRVTWHAIRPCFAWQVSNGRRRITHDRKRRWRGRTALEIISYLNKPAMKVANRHLPAPKRFPGSYPRDVFTVSPIAEEEWRGPPLSRPAVPSVIGPLSSPPSKPGVDKCVDHRICVPPAFYEEKPR